MSSDEFELSTGAMRRRCDPAQFDFASTAELNRLDEVIGQPRAVRAVSFGMGIDQPGYHIFALGAPGTGKTSLVEKYLTAQSADLPVPDDWCYVNNFDDPDKPRALRLPTGRGATLQKDLADFVQELENQVPKAFETDEYHQARVQIEEESERRGQELFKRLKEKAEARGFNLIKSAQGLAIAVKPPGEILSPGQGSAPLSESELEAAQKQLHDELRKAMREIQQLGREARERVRALDRQVVSLDVKNLIDELREKYAGLEAVLEFLDAVYKDILENVQALKKLRELREAQQSAPPGLEIGEIHPFGRYLVNLLVNHAETEGGPVVVELNPTFHNLVGRIEHVAQFGAMVTNFTMIKSGALHAANGGYLIVEARELLTKFLAWDALKRALRNQEIRVETMGREFLAVQSRTLEPEPIPLELKVVMLGDPFIYYILYNLDEDFRELFKVKADFGTDTDWTRETCDLYARFVGSYCRDHDLMHFDPSGVARTIEHAARLVSDQKKLATKFGELVDVITEASYWAKQNDHQLVSAADVQRAIDEKTFRSNRLEERLRELYRDGTLLIDTSGAVVGQVNGLSVLPLGDYFFGKPSRITARTHVGGDGIVHVDRETKLGGRLHNKGVLILAGYLGGTYALDVPLALRASITFEQSYEEVEGDSASSAELYALLSSLSDFPLRQDLAVTGSVNQRGEVQAIGSVNEKIEGFFDVCRLSELTGTQGVVIPRSNVQNLMLREDVVEAVRDGKFHVYAVSTIDEGIELLTGQAAGERQKDGFFPAGTVNAAVEARLRALAETAKKFSRLEGEKKEE